jgi:hypothetical protein
VAQVVETLFFQALHQQVAVVVGLRVHFRQDITMVEQVDLVAVALILATELVARHHLLGKEMLAVKQQGVRLTIHLALVEALVLRGLNQQAGL